MTWFEVIELLQSRGMSSEDNDGLTGYDGKLTQSIADPPTPRSAEKFRKITGQWPKIFGIE
jgi:hypothetical protein